MSRLIRSTIVLTALVPLALAAPVSAAPAQHAVYEESYSGDTPMTAADNPCGPWAGTFSESRTGSYKIVAPPAGQVDGEYHVNGAVAGSVELVPTDPSLPSYAGTYREKSNAVITGYDEEAGDDIARNARYALRAVLTGTDGSRLVLVLSGKLIADANGRTVVDQRVETCG